MKSVIETAWGRCRSLCSLAVFKGSHLTGNEAALILLGIAKILKSQTYWIDWRWKIVFEEMVHS